MESEYDAAWREYNSNPDKYWTKIAENLYWHKKWDKLYEMSAVHPMRWFVGGKLSVCYNCLDRQIEEGHGEKVTIISESDFTKQSYTLTYNQVFDQVIKLSGALLHFGVKENDHVLINLPTITEILISILAINRVGAVYLVMLEDSKNTMKERIDEFQPKVIITTNVGVVGADVVQIKLNIDSVLASCSHQPVGCIVLQRDGFDPAPMTENRDISWNDAMTKFQPFLSCVPVDACQPYFISYTAGSTGRPKAVVHAVGSFTVGLFKGDMITLGLVDDGPYYSVARFGWIGANGNVACGPMLSRTSVIVYEAPSPMNLRNLFQMWAKHNVTHIFLAFLSMKHVINGDPDGLIAKSCGPYKIKGCAFGGGVIDKASLDSFKKRFGAGIATVYAQSEYLGVTRRRLDERGNILYDQPWSSSGLVMPGCNVKILKDDMTEADVGEIGKIAIKLPVPPGILVDIFNNSDYLRRTYYETLPGYFDLKDDGKLDENGYLHVTNRSDDIYKVKDFKVSLTAIEEVAMQHPDVEDIVIVLDVIENDSGCYIPVGFYITKQNCTKSDTEVEKEMLALIHGQLNDVIIFRRLCHVQRFPTLPASSKVARGIIQNLVRNYQHMMDPPQIEDSNVIHLWDVLKGGIEK